MWPGGQEQAWPAARRIVPGRGREGRELLGETGQKDRRARGPAAEAPHGCPVRARRCVLGGATAGTTNAWGVGVEAALCGAVCGALCGRCVRSAGYRWADVFLSMCVG